MTKALTDKRLEALEKAPAPATRQEIPDGLLPGLYLIRQPSKAMSWAVRYRAAGKPRKATIGPYPAIGITAARDLGRKALRAAAEGRDPAREKQEAKVEAKRQAAEERRAERDLFENVAIDFIEIYSKPRANKKGRPDAWKETARILGLKADPDDPKKLIEHRGEFIPNWRGRKIQDITKRDVLERLNQIANRDAPIMANRALAAIRKMFNWAVGQDVLHVSPCVGITAPSPEQSRDRILSDEELRLVWNAADAEGWPFGPIIKLLILTGQREAEVAGMRSDEIDAGSRMWNLVAQRTKNNKRHDVPLSDAALEIIETQPTVGGFLFSVDGKRPVTTFSRAKDRIDTAVTKALGPDAKPLPHWTFHDLRRTVVSGMARLKIALPVIEKAINHKSGSFKGVVGVYQHHDFAEEKRAALDAWASFVQTIVSNQDRANVFPIRA
ncbi:tyrosine-type recombinase/integrase [Bradyrhizobium jicamae]|uniref:Tyrosine-type recombinase/integrase n=1 Tax=Bradyrhizobium jicamae TaxID=280332 RepID=A0ABS5FLR2_9BRAD|nr:site-specific integrase [Bradyrhizobium jicamae]MBR0797311.1 tyrosine-type recombinase/integrase [Bradyrhizobium jicamae]